MFCAECGNKMLECPSCKINYCKKCKKAVTKSLISKAFDLQRRLTNR